MAKHLLQETGDFLLLETGDKIILDTSYLIAGIASIAGSPVADAKITLIREDTNLVIGTYTTGADGYYEFLNLDVTKKYHCAAELDDTVDLWNTRSLPFLTPVN
jgi:hypothetical protein